MKQVIFDPFRTKGWLAAGGVVALLIGAPLSAQSQQESKDSADNLLPLKQCQSVSNDAERLACFDRAVSALVTASDAGNVRVIDREDVRTARRKLFGLSVPDVELLKTDKDDEDDPDLLETQVTSVRYLSGRKIRFKTTEDALWEIKNAPKRLRKIEAGDTVVLKKAALGTVFIRINGQLGVKGKRVQ